MDDIGAIFAYHPPKDEATKAAHTLVRELCKANAYSFDDLLPESREKSMALTNLQEAMMCANAAIAIHGLDDPPPIVRDYDEIRDLEAGAAPTPVDVDNGMMGQVALDLAILSYKDDPHATTETILTRAREFRSFLGEQA